MTGGVHGEKDCVDYFGAVEGLLLTFALTVPEPVADRRVRTSASAGARAYRSTRDVLWVAAGPQLLAAISLYQQLASGLSGGRSAAGVGFSRVRSTLRYRNGSDLIEG